MRKIMLHIIMFFLLVSCSQNEQTDFDSGILWEIEAKSGLKSFLFGTIHLYPKNEIELSDKVFSTLQSCNILALESDITDQSNQQKFADFEMPDFLMKSYEVTTAEYGDSLVSMEMELVKKALEADLAITELEPSDEILNIMETVRNIEIDQNTLLKERVLSDYRESLSQYKNESIGKFYKSMEIQMGENLTKILVDERNKNWIEDIESLIQNNRVFIAVGAGHLGGENGILNLLAEEGYNIRRVE